MIHFTRLKALYLCRRLIIVCLWLSLSGCTDQLSSSHFDQSVKVSPTDFFNIPDSKQPDFFSQVILSSEKTASLGEPTKQIPRTYESGISLQETKKEGYTKKTLPDNHAALDQEIDYDQQTKAQLLQSVFKKLELSIEQPFNIVDAIAVGIKFNRVIKISNADYQGSLGSLQIQQGTFDASLNASATHTRDYSYDTDVTQYDTTSISSTLTRIFRSGIQVSVGENATGGDYTSTHSDTSKTESNLQFQIMVPLLKGRGQVSAAAAETSASIDAKAAEMTTEHTFSTVVETISNDYWDYLQAINLLKLAIDAEARSEKMFSDTKVLVEREAKPRSFLSSLEADMATKQAGLYSREQEVFRSRNQLALDLGIPVSNAALLPVASMAFPDFQLDETQLLMQQKKKLYAIALKHRKDLQSARLSLKSIQVLEDKAKRDLLPELNLTLGNNRHGWADSGGDLADAFRRGDTGYSYGLTLSFPLQNNAALGQLRLQRSQTKRSQLTLKQLEEQIYNDVTVAANGLYQACAQLVQHREAEKMYRRALTDELLRFHLNKATLLDVMDAQDRLNNAQSAVVTAQAALAKSLITLRYNTGTLFCIEEDSQRSLTINNFTTLPISNLQ
jgi:outer membrane protein TolC